MYLLGVELPQVILDPFPRRSLVHHTVEHGLRFLRDESMAKDTDDSSFQFQPVLFDRKLIGSQFFSSNDVVGYLCGKRVATVESLVGNRTATTCLLGLPALLPLPLKLRRHHYLPTLPQALLSRQAHFQIHSQRLPSIDHRTAVIASISALHPPTCSHTSTISEPSTCPVHTGRPNPISRRQTPRSRQA